jgi:hypothetical protein
MLRTVAVTSISSRISTFKKKMGGNAETGFCESSGGEDLKFLEKRLAIIAIQAYSI